MYKNGLVSISFRGYPPEEILKAAKEAGLSCIEWGSDVHAPCKEHDRLEQIVRLQEKYGVTCCSYGTYFRLGITPLTELPDYIRAAKALGTKVLRLWCGNKKAEEYAADERAFLLSQCWEAAAVAEKEEVQLCLECHHKTYTETVEGALEVLRAVNSPAFRMYWQPNQFRTPEENFDYLEQVKDYITHIHVFQWKGKERFPLETGLEEWKTYLRELTGEHTLLLEFMPDDDLCSLNREAAALHKLTEAIL